MMSAISKSAYYKFRRNCISTVRRTVYHQYEVLYIIKPQAVNADA